MLTQASTHCSEKSILSRKISIKRKSNSKPDLELTRNSLISKIKKVSQKNQQLQENFLNFIISNNSQHADFTKIEAHYQSKLIRLHSKYNDNKLSLQKKKEQYSKLLSTIEYSLKQNYIIVDDSYLAVYNKRITDLKKLIKIKEHEFDCYKNNYSRIYKENYLIKKRLDQERNFEKKGNEQYEEYNIIKEQALKVLNNQSKILKTVNNIYEISNLKNSDEIEGKLKKLNRLDLLVLGLKNEISYKENEIEVIKSRQQNIKNESEFYSKLNMKVFTELLAVKKEFYQQKLKFEKILLELRKNKKIKKNEKIQLVIQTYNSQQINYNNYIHKFNISNKEIENLYKLTNKLEQEKEEISKNIKKEQKRVNIYKKQNSFDITKSLTLIKTQIANINNEILKKSIKFEQILNLLLSLIQKSNKFIVKWNNHFNLEKSSCIIQFHNHIKSNCLYYSFDKNSRLFQVKTLAVKKNIYLELFHIFNNTIMTLFFISLDKISHVYQKEGKFHPSNSIIIENYFGEEFLSFLELHFTRVKDEHQKKSILITQTNELFNKRKVTFQNLKPEYNRDTSVRINLNSVSKQFIQNHPRKSIVMINKYLNYHIKSKEEISIFKKPQNSSSNFLLYLKGRIQENIHPEQPIISESKRNKTEENFELIVDSIDYEEKDSTKKPKNTEKKNSIKKIKNIQFYSNNTEYNKIYQRRNDLRKLELNYFNSKEQNMLTNQEFSLIYQKLKTNYKQKHQNKRPRSLSGMNSSSASTSILPKVHSHSNSQSYKTLKKQKTKTNLQISTSYTSNI